MGDPNRTSTAHRFWDDTWRTEHGRCAWSAADPWVVSGLPAMRDRGVGRTLDLGCGPGRHAVLFARNGLESHGLDASAYGVEHAARAAREAGVEVALKQGSLAALPYPDGFFDYVLAFNVIYHGTEIDAARALSEVRRVLRPGGLYQSTMLSKRNVGHGRGERIAPNTFVQPGGPGDKAHPHLFADEHDLLRLHGGFRLLSAEDRDQTGEGEHHWYCLFEA
ncbi:MAG: class I SAM-dependent methyltransferase [Actinocrinis sp.]